MDIAKQIKAARKQRRLSQSEAAKAWGFNVDTLQAWEASRNSPSGENLIKLIRLGVVDLSASTKKRRS